MKRTRLRHHHHATSGHRSPHGTFSHQPIASAFAPPLHLFSPLGSHPPTTTSPPPQAVGLAGKADTNWAYYARAAPPLHLPRGCIAPRSLPTGYSYGGEGAWYHGQPIGGPRFSRVALAEDAYGLDLYLSLAPVGS
ncbi:Zinc finger protein [Musa troglodytarum]|uniref:Zinc finger protein n=1 Tax=Musa troglodytarum TaxID=320322 RepID=A0A9E7HJH3_9LILI|nr:Zinc finger protein [Musa troglodytarum]